MITDLQREVWMKVSRASRRRLDYFAADEAERLVLANLCRRKLVSRKLWRAGVFVYTLTSDNVEKFSHLV